MTTGLDDFFLSTELIDPKDEQVIVKLMRLLQARIQRRNLLREDVHEKQNHFRNMLVELEHENVSLKYCNNEQKKMISLLEDRVSKLQNQIDNLLYKLNSSCDILRNMQQELKDRDRQLKQHTIDKQKIIQECNAKTQIKIDRMTEELETKLSEQRKLLMSYVRERDEKLRLVKQLLTPPCKNISNTVAAPMASSSEMANVERSIPTISEEKPSMTTFIDPQVHHPSKNCHGQINQTLPFRARKNSNDVQRRTADGPIPMTSKEEPPIASNLITEIAMEPISTTPTSPSPSKITSVDIIAVTKSERKMKLTKKDKIPVVNPRYQRSQNVDRWIDHRPTGMVPTGTILQPQTQLHKRIIRKLTNPKDFVARSARSARYSLLSQEQDTDGELETKLYKADVLPTCGGGAQIVFNDIECLKQISPIRTKRRDGQINLKSSPTDI